PFAAFYTVMAGLVPAIHVSQSRFKTWMPAPSASMTRSGACQRGFERRRMPDQDIDDMVDVIEIDNRHPGFRQRHVGSDRHDRGILRGQERRTGCGAMHLELWMRPGLVALDDHEIDRRQPGEKGSQRRLCL